MSENKQTPEETYTNQIDDVITKEKERIGVDNEKKLLGLALSGGGIRSASFGLGVLQALVSKNIDLLKHVDYLSTVSGGGYIGSSLTYFLKKGLPNGKPAGTSANNFPFGFKGAGSRTKKDGNEILDFIRQHGKYLTPNSKLGFLSLLGAVFRSTFVSLLVYFSLAVLIMNTIYCFGLFGTRLYLNILGFELLYSGNLTSWLDMTGFFHQNLLLALSLLITGVVALISILYSIGTSMTTSPYPFSNKIQQLLGQLWMFVLILLVVGSMPLLENIITPEISSSSSLLGMILGFYEQFRNRKPSDKPGLFTDIRIIFGAILLIYGLLFSAFYVGVGIAEAIPDKNFAIQALLFIVPVILIGLFVNLNIFGLHRMYRDRLMETFMADRSSIINNKWAAAAEANSTSLEEMCVDSNTRPYHIINTNLVTINSNHPKFSGRGGDNFILSPIYCGSDATGWQQTVNYRKHWWNNNGLTLPTAMAISGAAVNPSAGPNGQGLTKSRPVSMLMGLLNIQLGFWSDNPNPEKNIFSMLPTNYLSPGLSGNVLGRNLTEDKSSILLTDGGHFENLAVYELIRRKLKVIIVSDAGADPDYQFQDLTNMIEKIRVDFGVKIEFTTAYPLENVVPDEKNKEMGGKINLAQKGFAVADIYYGENNKGLEEKGILIYIKSTLPPGLPKDLYGYKLNNPSFPDESTADQFFSEVQFEAYRELGYQLGKKVNWENLWDNFPDREFTKPSAPADSDNETIPDPI